MKTILGFSSAALAGAATQSIAAAANSGHTVMLNLRYTILYPFIRLFLTGWEPPDWEWGASKSLRRRSSGLGDEPALDTRSSPWRGPRWIQSIAPIVAVPSPARNLRRPSED